MSNTTKTFDTPIQPATQQPIAEFSSSIIPKSFQLGGLTINVRLDPTLAEQHNIAGQAIYQTQEILIAPGVLPLQSTEQVFLHELVHWIFYMMGENDLRNNERIVDCFAHFLYQALTTAEPLPAARNEDAPYEVDEA